MKLLRLIRRRRLAYELLDEYDREPISHEDAVRQLTAFAAAASRDFPAWQDPRNPRNVRSWAEAAREKAKAYQ